jgi:hypothetical protein
MKVSIVGRIGRALNPPAGFVFSDPPDQQLSVPARLRFAYPSKIKRKEDVSPLRRARFFVFRNKLVRVEDAGHATRGEILLRVKHKVLSQEKAFTNMTRAVELFDKMEGSRLVRRLPISEDVRILVWRRDGGKCVVCGGQERLEFDHVIPVDKGGSSTARNIQLLCETCNRQKGATI